MKLPSIESCLDFHPLVYVAPVCLQDSLAITKLHIPVKIILFFKILYRLIIMQIFL